MRRTRPVVLWRVLRLLLLLSSVMVALSFIPTPYTLKAPGRADDLSRMVAVEGGRHNFRGKLLMTTVIYERANLFFCLYAALDPASELVTQEPLRIHRIDRPIHPPLVHNQMEASKLTAKLVALRLMHVPVHLSTNGVRIVSFLPTSLATEHLKTGDVIEQVDETNVQRYQDLRTALHGKHPGELVRMRVERAGTTLEEQVPTIDADGHTMIGIEVENCFDDGALPKRITINSRSIQGGSAGMMFTLEILRQLRGEDLSHGYVVAGTGTIDDVGDVGPVEGVAQKLVAAQRAGATIFLLPEENVSDLPKDTHGVRIIPVRTIQDALSALRHLRG